MTGARAAGAYPPPDAPMDRASFDAMLATLSTWVTDRGRRLVELDEVAAVGPPAVGTDVDLAFVVWQAIVERRDALVATDWTDRSRPNLAVTAAVWAPLADGSGAELAANLPEAVSLVDELARRVAVAIDRSTSANVASHQARMAIDTDLAVIDRLASSLGQQVRAAADLRRELERVAGAQAGGPDDGSEGELDAAALARVRGDAAALRADLEATDRHRAATLAACADAGPTLDRLRALEAEARAAVAHCAEHFTHPPRLAVPSVEAVAALPADLADLPWSQARPLAEAFLLTVDRVERALRQVVDANTAPRRERDDLRGLLQAYRAKADSLGAAEHPDLDAAFRAAKRELWSAPCDLDRARELCSDYQRRVRLLPTTGSATRPHDGPSDREAS